MMYVNLNLNYTRIIYIMKLYKSFMFSALAAVAALATSCSDEGYWDAYAPESPEYSFAKAAENLLPP